MALSSGTRFGPYEILATIGAGGMGEVYRARDTKLGRELALKVLPVDVAMDADRLNRFEQEARSASALNHPNIVTIYEIGRIDATSYIAMELVSGRTLRDLIVEGPLPIRRLLALAAQIADGLARAHDAGIVHRDLKPENVMVTREGIAKILDFGLAKLVAAAGSDTSQLATVASPTQPGLVLGTVGYMSPEQASGKPVDFRSDQFSFGALLYEMATARRPFSRNTTAETLAAVIRDEPEPLHTLVPQLPVAFRWVIERCLAKDPEERYASTRDLARDLAHLRDHASEVSHSVSVVTPPRRRHYGWLVLATGWLVAAGAIGSALLGPRSEPATLPVRFTVPLPPGVTYAPSEVSRGFSISPDGTRLVIEAFSKTRRHLYLRPLDSEDFAELEGSLDATSHFLVAGRPLYRVLRRREAQEDSGKRRPTAGSLRRPLRHHRDLESGRHDPLLRYCPRRDLSCARHRRRARPHRRARSVGQRGERDLAALPARRPAIRVSRGRRG